ncbi:ATP-binding protein [Kribbella sp. NPDC003505]|uniref:ATP-binding protein n=1 Tax=Kribbella sp. NPDC003505 TaxID=3154448 RepID=UPI0033AC340D
MGIGKTDLIEYVAGRVAGWRSVRASGVESEQELAFAGLHQVCAPVLEFIETLPTPQQEVLRTAFGLAPGKPPDRFVVGLAVLGLLGEASRDRPLLCLIDDAQWLDQASAQVLGFVTRRLRRQPAGSARASAGLHAGRARGRIRVLRAGGAAGAYRGELPAPDGDAVTRDAGGAARHTSTGR